MAYSLYEKPQLKAAKNIQYYPEEYDYSDYYDVERMKNIETPVSTPRKYKKTLPSIDYENERKCPIYIHQFNKSPNPSMYNNYSPRNCDNFSKPKQLPTKKSKQQNSKLMLDKLEETYWATWKPNKEPKATKNAKMRISDKEVKAENKRREGMSEHIIKYFAASDFSTSSGSVLNGAENSADRLETTTNTQEIQTDYVPPIILLENKHYDSTSSVSERLAHMEISKLDEINTPESKLGSSEESQETVKVDNDARSSGTLVKEDKTEEGKTTVKTPKKTVKKLLNHTDSFIIHKKKQDEIKDDVQQPRCIKLYKKTASTFLKGGSYPLKSCLAKVSSEKGNFKLGSPGSPLFVTSNSFNKKYSR